MKFRKYSDIKIGEKAELKRTISEGDIEKFAKLSGDYNPIHLDEEFAQSTMFKGRIAHGILTTSFISTVIARDLPGPSSIYLGQNASFRKPVRIGDTLLVKVEVIQKIDEKEHIRLKTTCTNQNNELVLDGEALVMLMKM
ncbi:MAG: MaoC family dehydratase [Promethearchaeota archaeon]